MFPQPLFGLGKRQVFGVVHCVCGSRRPKRTAPPLRKRRSGSHAMALAVAYPARGYQPGCWGLVAGASIYSPSGVLARCGMLAQGERRSGRWMRWRLSHPAVQGISSCGRVPSFAALRTICRTAADTKSSAPHRYRSGDDGAVRCGMGPAGGGRCELCRAGAAGVRRNWWAVLNNVRFIDQLMYPALTPGGGVAGAGWWAAPAPQSPAHHGAAVCRCLRKTAALLYTHRSGSGCNGAVRRLRRCSLPCRQGVALPLRHAGSWIRGHRLLR